MEEKGRPAPLRSVLLQTLLFLEARFRSTLPLPAFQKLHKTPGPQLASGNGQAKKNPVVVHICPTHLQSLTQWWPLLGALNSLKKLLRMSPASPEVTQQCRGLLKTFVKSFCKQNCHQVCLLHTALQTQVSDTTLTPAPRHRFPKLLSPGE